MGIPKQFNDIIQKHINVHAAWLPVTNTFELGDYGIVSDGVFTKMGNVKEFTNVARPGKGPDASLDFTSANTTVIKFAAGSQVDVIPGGAIDAKITFKFEKERSFLVKAPVISVSTIENVNEVANKLRDAKGWRRKWKVVYQTYHALDPVIVSTISAGTEVTFSGDASALKSMKIGNASVNLNTTKELGLNIHGKAGVIGLGLFKLKLIGGGTEFLSTEEKKKPAEIDYLDKQSLEDDL